MTALRKVYYISLKRYSTDVKKSIGFIGLGQMGFRMANNLRKAHQGPFHIYDTNPQAIEEFQKLHPVEVANSPLEMASKTSVIISMLPAAQHVKQVYLGKDGIFNQVKEGTTLIDSSTIDPISSKEVAKEMEKKGALMYDAPVSGGILGAEAGTLTFMVGAKDEQKFDQVKEYLQPMGKTISYCGEIGNGQVAKICNNMLLAITMIGTSEAIHLGEKMGMDKNLLADIINQSSGRNWSSEIYNPVPGVLNNVPANRDYEGGFGVQLMLKDLNLANDTAKVAKSSIFLGALAQQIYSQVSQTQGFEKKDFSSVYKWLKGESFESK